MARDGRGTETYATWRSMIMRCEAKSNRSYRYYGGLGITVCQRWRESFEAFLEDMGERPTTAHSIDRENNDGNYEPSNCRWATASNQNRHRGGVKLTEVAVREIRAAYRSGDLQKTIAERHGVTASLVSMIVTGRIWKLDDAVTGS